MTRVLLVDDHPVVRRGLAAMLTAQPDLEVVGECADGLDALEKVAELEPDLVVLDLMLPGLSGHEVARRIASERPAVRVLVLTLHAHEGHLARVLSSGAHGLVQKDAHPDALLRAIRKVLAGERHFPPRLAESRGSSTARDPWESLTDREREVALLSAEGLSYADIGGRLGISPRTAEVHRGNVLRKLHLSGTAELVRFVVRRGLSSADEG